MSGIVFNIQRFSIHDGPGIRTTVFLKGCNLRCAWCHNPESFDPCPEIHYFSKKCINCGKCIDICDAKAHQSIKGIHVFEREKCTRCGTCAEYCYAEALVMSGRSMLVEEVIAEVEKDREFYNNSGGGVTFSGGEPLFQKDFLKDLLKESKRRGLNTAVESALNINADKLGEIIAYTDLFLVDIKLINAERHRQATCADNKLIHENIRRLAQENVDIRIRVPVIPSFNDNLKDMEEIAEFIEEVGGITQIEILPYHGMAQEKYSSLGIEYKMKNIIPPSASFLAEARELFEKKGLKGFGL